MRNEDARIAISRRRQSPELRERQQTVGYGFIRTAKNAVWGWIGVVFTVMCQKMSKSTKSSCSLVLKSDVLLLIFTRMCIGTIVGCDFVVWSSLVLEDIYNDQNRIILYYVKEIEKYDEFDLRQFAAKVKRLEKHEASLEEKVTEAVKRCSNSPKKEYDVNDFVI